MLRQPESLGNVYTCVYIGIRFITTRSASKHLSIPAVFILAAAPAASLRCKRRINLFGLDTKPFRG
jgi:hypothetical protein